MKLGYSLQLNEIYSNIKFHENPSNWNRVVPCEWTDGQTDMTKLIVAFRNVANAPKKEKKIVLLHKSHLKSQVTLLFDVNR